MTGLCEGGNEPPGSLKAIIPQDMLLVWLVSEVILFSKNINIFETTMRLSVKKAAKQYNVVCCCDENPNPRIPIKRHVTNTVTSHKGRFWTSRRESSRNFLDWTSMRPKQLVRSAAFRNPIIRLMKMERALVMFAA
ncbi:hypothetical protein ANN_25890 [Periplaneta americana]|uniref:Uncharacterized protein n=1 Tax=Periplaneta americana TaxID=6978 RepID=A0ABQ8S4U7_PERAM|nr:hypothetical protein ANN_25890 [Periplaneta americana]